jgi:hypothetical protein
VRQQQRLAQALPDAVATPVLILVPWQEGVTIHQLRADIWQGGCSTLPGLRQTAGTASPSGVLQAAFDVEVSRHKLHGCGTERSHHTPQVAADADRMGGSHSSRN